MTAKAETIDPKFPYQCLAFYKFCTVENPQMRIADHKRWFANRDVTARIYINEQGINGQMCITTEQAQEYIDWLRSFACFSDTLVKVQGHHEQAFPRCSVKYREQLVALDLDVDMDKRGKHLSPAEWKKMLEEDDDHLIVDVRNEYEWRVGHFEGAELPKCDTFREFADYTKALAERVDPKKTKVMMYCTGGIRCEVYSPLMAAHGFEEIYQLSGGVINYGAEENGEHWKGKLFVFDDRLAVPVGDDNKEVIGKCRHCSEGCETFYNCANVDCNELFLSCHACLEEHRGCCKDECAEAPRVRQYQKEGHKPFRRWHEVVDAKEDLFQKPA